MAKRDSGTTRRGSSATKKASTATTSEAVEQRLVAFAEQLGRIAGTLQAKAEGWLDRETLNQQIASVRDGASDLLTQLARAATEASKQAKASTKAKASTVKQQPAATVRTRTAGRSGGVVDAPGKKHRRPLPSDPDANMADSQAAKMRTARTMIKTTRHRGRG
jgi:hypothetical protein